MLTRDSRVIEGAAKQSMAVKEVSAATTLEPYEQVIDVTTPASSNFAITLPPPSQVPFQDFMFWSKNAGGGTATVTQPASSQSTASYALKGAGDYVILRSNGRAYLELGKVITA